MTRIKISISKQLFVIKCRGQLDNTVDTYSGGLRFKPRLG